MSLGRLHTAPLHFELIEGRNTFVRAATGTGHDHVKVAEVVLVRVRRDARRRVLDNLLRFLDDATRQVGHE